MTTLCIADHVPMFLHGMRSYFRENDGIDVVHSLACAESADACLSTYSPTVLLASLELVPSGGIDLVRSMRRRGDATPVLLYGTWKSASLVELARSLNVQGMIDRRDTPEEFRLAVHRLSTHRSYVSASVRAVLMEGRRRRRSERLLDGLTGTELQVLVLLAGSRTSRQIGETLCISERTVQKHRQNISRKLSLSGSNALLSFAMRHADVLRSSFDTSQLDLAHQAARANVRRSKARNRSLR